MIVTLGSGTCELGHLWLYSVKGENRKYSLEIPNALASEFRKCSYEQIYMDFRRNKTLYFLNFRKEISSLKSHWKLTQSHKTGSTYAKINPEE